MHEIPSDLVARLDRFEDDLRREHGGYKSRDRAKRNAPGNHRPNLAGRTHDFMANRRHIAALNKRLGLGNGEVEGTEE